ncbi:MAG: phosphoribosylformylglycinamidine synthase I [Candidatus Micrarchaeia archaeon]|jgi:phosphoribosylformylglycinamidine synthase
MKVAVIRFPAANCDLDALHAMRDVVKTDVQLVWHTDFKGSNFDAVILPGGFSYGDHLRAGVIAAFSPAMKEVREMASEGKPVLGICNGFQILTEAGLLPGALLRNASTLFACKWVTLKCESTKARFAANLKKGQLVHVPIAHGEGRYVNDEKMLDELEQNNQIIFRYCDESGTPTAEANPNGSLRNIAGICNLDGNVMGMMPHPERASEAILGGTEGLNILKILR